MSKNFITNNEQHKLQDIAAKPLCLHEMWNATLIVYSRSWIAGFLLKIGTLQ